MLIPRPLRFRFLFVCCLAVLLHSSANAARHIVAWGDNRQAQLDAPNGLTNVVSFAAGWFHALALLSDGTIAGWGDNSAGQLNSPADLTNAVAIAAGNAHTIALRTDGTVLAWGDNQVGQTDVPAGLKDVVSIASYGSYNVAVQRDGTLAFWGFSGGPLIPPSNMTNVIRVATGMSSIAALRADGQVIDWSGAVLFTAEDQIIDLAAGQFHFLGLKRAGTVVAWGENGFGQSSVPGITNAVRIFAGDHHSGAVLADGTVRVWGDNQYRQLEMPMGLTNVSSIAAGGGYTVAYGELLPAFQAQPTNLIVFSGETAAFNVNVTGDSPIIYQWYRNGSAIDSGTNSSLQIRNSSLNDTGEYYVVASNPAGQVQSSTATLAVQQSAPAILSYSTNITSFDGGSPTLSVAAQGSLPLSYQWRFNGNELPGATNSTLSLSSISIASAGSYDVVISNQFGSIASAGMNLELLPFAFWGPRDTVVDQLPIELTNAAAVSFGGRHAIALRADGTVLAWGSGGPTNVPAGLSNVIAIAAGVSHNLALRADGSVAAWGGNSSRTNVPPTATNIVAIAASYELSLALRDDGTVIGWGSTAAKPPADLSNVVAIAAAFDSGLALKRDGTLVSWGSARLRKIPVSATNVIAISAGDSHALALRRDGTVVSWGVNMGDGRTQVPAGLSNVVAVSAGFDNSLALRADGTVVAWGANYSGQTNVPPNLKNAVSISAGAALNAAFIGNGSPRIVSQPEPPIRNFSTTTIILDLKAAGSGVLNYQWLKDGVEIPAATNSTFVLSNAPASASGLYRLRVSNALGTTTSFAIPVVIENIPPRILLDPSTIVAWRGAVAAFDVKAEGPGPLSFQWEFNGNALPFANSPSLNLSNLTTELAGKYRVRISNAYGTTYSAEADLFLTPVVAWGRNLSGETNVPGTLAGDAAHHGLQIKAIAAGWNHNLVLRGDGTIAAWGRNTSGQTLIPSSATNVIAIAAGGSHSLALRSDGTVLAWGDVADGKIEVPAGLSNVVRITAGWSHSLALRADGTVVAWGYNFNGQTDPPAGLGDVVAIAAGDRHSLALMKDGRVIGWGDDTYGQATAPASLTNAVEISAGGSYSVALRADGTVLAWGADDMGQTDVPADLMNIVAIAAGHDHVIALRGGGTLAGWGSNANGQLAFPQTLGKVRAVSAGQTHSMVLLDESLPTPSLRDPLFESGVFTFSVQAKAGSGYRIEFRDSSQSHSWNLLTNIIATGDELLISDPAAVSRYKIYRAGELP